MRILSMTATFGKLEHETLTLKPGLNIVQAPNEWGKSTWCAFLTAMLYGVDTRAKSTKSALADKEHYAPWSGSPMAGRLEIDWKGRRITIERKTRGRIPMGEFRAFETETGIAVPELTATNCGEMLLGVERSVWTRAGFIRLSDLPVTRDEALMRRLNALVTTGDESGDGERLARGLRELKNRCRYHRTGLIPRAETERAALEETLREREMLEEQETKLRERLAQVNDWISRLENRRDALNYAAAQADAGRVAQAEEQLREARARLEEMEAVCSPLPPREETEWALAALNKLMQDYLDLQMEAQMLPLPRLPREPEGPFRGMSGQEAERQNLEDREKYAALRKKNLWLLIPGILLLAAGAAAAVLKWPVWGTVCAGVGLAGVIAWLLMQGGRKRKAAAIAARYGSEDPEQWRVQAKEYADWLEAVRKENQRYQIARDGVDKRMKQLKEKILRCTGGRDPRESLGDWQRAVEAWNDWADAYREEQKAENLVKTLTAMAKSARKPWLQDDLTYSAEETARLLSDTAAERQQIQNRLSQYRGRMETLEPAQVIREKLGRVNKRLKELEDTYAALAIAQQMLSETVTELQRRFSPQVSRRARELMAELTGGRYCRLTLGEDFSIRAGAETEDTLWDALWRSDGTVDQLYLALRLAVAEVLAVDAPLVLDDALVRFDDERLKAAVRILKKEGERKQVILFTCQSREANIG